MGYKFHRNIQFSFCHNLIRTEPGNHFDILLRQSQLSVMSPLMEDGSRDLAKLVVKFQRQSSNFLNSLLLPNGASLSGEWARVWEVMRQAGDYNHSHHRGLELSLLTSIIQGCTKTLKDEKRVWFLVWLNRYI